MKEKGSALRDIKVIPKGTRWRYNKTIEFLEGSIKAPCRILDLGTDNPLAKEMREKRYEVDNTIWGQDLDDDYDIVQHAYDCVTAFEIFEHMVAPYNLLKKIKAPRLIASIPLKLWFAQAYWNDEDEWDRHYHEYEPRQFDMLLNKAGWKIVSSEKWKPPFSSFGIRPVLRALTDRYYIVYCERLEKTSI